MSSESIHQTIKDLPGWLDPLDIEKFASLGLPRKADILELGTHYGRAAISLRLLYPSASIATCDTIDMVDRALLASYNITFYHEAGYNLPWKKKLDLLFIDDDHVGDTVARDIEKYKPLIKPGGYIVCHDYYGTDVQKTVDALLPGGVGVKTGEFSQYIWKNEWNIPFSRPDIGKEEIEASNLVDRSGWLAAGRQTEAFEAEFAAYVGVKYAIFTNSCTSALKMAYKWAMDTKGVDMRRLTMPRNTFCATYSAADEVFGDNEYIDWTYYDEDLFGYGERVNMHYGGVKDETPCLIEDSAHRIEPNDPLVGNIRCYSFYATKNMTTRQGGMLVTNDKEIYDRCRLFWRDGLSTSSADRERGVPGYQVLAMAGGYDNNDSAAAIGRVQLKRLPEFTRRRNEIVRRYNSELGQNWTGNHLYPYMLTSEAAVYQMIAYMKQQGIDCRHHYPGTGWSGMSLPLYPLLTDDEVTYIIEAVMRYDRVPKG